MIAAIQLGGGPGLGQGPISDLFGGPPQLPAQPAPSPSPGGGTNWLVVVVLVGVLGYFTWLRFDEGVGPGPGPKPDDEKRQVEPEPKGHGKTLIFIHERNPQSIEHDLLLREMPQFCSEKKLQFRALDDDLSEEPLPLLLSFAKSKNIEPPFVILTDANDKPWRAIKWPSDKAGLSELFK